MSPVFSKFNELDWSDIIERAKPKYPLYTLLWFTSTAGLSYYIYWQFYGNPCREKREDLEKKLTQAEKQVRDLERKLLSLEQTDIQIKTTNEPKREIRIWMDGAFDMMHFGHMNAFRLGRSLGTYLIAGVNSDETITKCKGKPVCNEAERIATVRGCKFVDEVVEGVPYVMNEEYLNYIFEKYKIDYVVHGDDPCIVDGKNVYEAAVRMGKYLTIPRTEGISTTDIVGRMLLLTREHHSTHSKGEKLVRNMAEFHSEDEGDDQEHHEYKDAEATVANYRRLFSNKSKFLTTSRVIRLFGSGVKAPEPGQKVVYLAGAWDMFHAGHLEILEKAKKSGDYVLVGVHNDYIVNQRQGMNLPIMNLNERALSVLGCKYVDDVLIDAPYIINKEMIASLKIDYVIRGCPKSMQTQLENETESEDDPYALPKQLGILQIVYCDYDLSALDFVERIQNQRERYSERFKKKSEAENDFYKTKYNF